jgi:leucyl aminopeptidase (aminopeptidase T)
MRGVRLRFSEGRVFDASAESEEGFLLETLRRRIGELGKIVQKDGAWTD